jgi:carbamoyltransferase
MKDGFYLSTYLNPAGLARLVYVRLRHSNNLSLWEKRGADVRLVRHWELERITGQKTHRTPFLTLADEHDFIETLLAPLGLSLDEIVEIWGTPDLATAHPSPFPEVPDVAFHAVSHLYSAILMDSNVFFEGTVLGIAVDRGPDRVIDGGLKDHWFAGCVVRQGTVEIFPVESPGPLYCEARDRFRLREGTLMALATATTASGPSTRMQLLSDNRFDGGDVVERSRDVLDQICRDVETSLVRDPRFTDRESFISAVMKEVQAVSVAIMERNVETIATSHDLDTTEAHLAIAGGYGLNCPTNSHLMRKYGFRTLLAPPSVGDEGQSVGIALAAFHHRLSSRFNFAYPGPYLGRSDRDLDQALADHDGFVSAVDDYDESRAVDDLVAGPVVWFDGASEVGPRALGNRSILADPTSPTAKLELNVLKQREWWRPVAPVVLEDQLNRWFEDARPSPYMLETFTIRTGRRDDIPAVAHLDASARVQSLRREQNPRLYDLISAFEKRTGVAMLCNTSLNDKGEPIIDKIAEALDFCLRKGVPVAYVNGRRVALRNFEAYEAEGPSPRCQAPFLDAAPQRADAVRLAENPYGLTDLHLHVYLADPALTALHDIRTVDGAGAVREVVECRLASDPTLRERAVRAMEKNRVHFSAFGWQPLIPERPVASMAGGG